LPEIAMVAQFETTHKSESTKQNEPVVMSTPNNATGSLLDVAVNEPLLQIVSPFNFIMSSEQLIGSTNAALLRALKFAGVEFVRYISVDSSNNTRSKAAPLKRLVKSNNFDYQVSIAEVCFGGLPAYGDAMVSGSTVDARRVVVLKPDMSTLRILPYAKRTAMVMGSLYDPSNHQVSSLCTRGLLGRVLETAMHHGIAFQVGAELEFSLVTDGGDLSLGQLPRPVDASVFANTTTLNDQQDFISDLYQQLEEQEIEIELVHAESAPGQLEVVLSYHTNVMTLADNVVFARETIRSVARKHKLRALFLPKISAMAAGNGMHLHFSFRDLHSSNPHENAFPSKDQRDVPSRKGGAFIEGVLEHLPSLLALTLPSVNSFRRVGKGCWTGHSVSWNTEDKESPLRVCLDLQSGEASNVEMKLSDSMANVHLALAGVLSSGLDGILRNLALRPSADDNPQNNAPLPTSLQESLELLRQDKLLSLVLGHDLLTNYVAIRSAEVEYDSKLTLHDEVVNAYNKA
jgi:glutamine synthetase